MAYLSGADNAFETTINRGWTSARSAQLAQLVASVKQYIQSPTQANIRQVAFDYDCWMTLHPKEFDSRGKPIQAAFENELVGEYRKQGIKCDADFAPTQGADLPSSPAVTINRWSTFKRGAKLTMTAGSYGVSAAQTATGTGLTALAVGSAAAVSATGVGLLAGGLALSVASSVLSGVSAWKTKKHKDALIKIYESRNKPPFDEARFCQLIPDGDRPLPKPREAYIQHDMIANFVLPYVIAKKNAKINHKMVNAVPIVGTAAESARAIAKKTYKFARGTLGAHRQNAAGWMACHLISCNCLLVQAVVAELYSEGEMVWLMEQQYGTVIEYLEPKLKST